MKKMWLGLGIFIILVIGITSESEAEGNGLSVQAHNHPNAIDANDQRAFNLKVIPHRTYELLVDVINHSNEDKQLSVAIVNAETTVSGTIGYANRDMKQLKNVDQYLTDMIDVMDEEVTVKANDKKTLIFKLNTPKSSFDGIRLGALFLEASEKKVAEKGLVNNQFSYSIPIAIQETEKQLVPELELTSLNHHLVNGKQKLELVIVNRQNTLVSGSEIKVEVSRNGQKVMTEKMSQIIFAPTAYFPYTMVWPESKLAPGSYQVAVEVTSPFGQWSWKKELNIEKEGTSQLNKQVTKGNEAKPYGFLWLGVGTILLLAVVMFLFRYLSKNKHHP